MSDNPLKKNVCLPTHFQSCKLVFRLLLTQVLYSVKGEEGISHWQLEKFSFISIWSYLKNHHRKFSLKINHCFSSSSGESHPSGVSEQYGWVRGVDRHVHRSDHNNHDQWSSWWSWCVLSLLWGFAALVMIDLIGNLWGVLKLLVRFRASGSNEPRPPGWIIFVEYWY